MLARFSGPDGFRRLVEVLKEHRLVEHDSNLAERLAKEGTITCVDQGAALVEQGGADNDLYFLLDGAAGIYVNTRRVAVRGPGDAIGEMAIVDPSARRSAAIRAESGLTMLKVSEPAFQAILHDFPEIWRRLAKQLAHRLRQRAAFHRPPNTVPILFLGSSTEGLPVAREIHTGLKYDNVDVCIWTDGVFGPSGMPVESLLEKASTADFAAFVFGPDDRVASRGNDLDAPRDNVVFELGLFMGNLGRQRSYIIMQHGGDIKIPSDLLGLTPITYIVRDKGVSAQAIAPVCQELRRAIESLGVR